MEGTGDEKDIFLRWQLDILRWIEKYEFSNPWDIPERKVTQAIGNSDFVIDMASASSVTDNLQPELRPHFANGLLLSTFCSIADHVVKVHSEAILAQWTWVASANWAALQTYPAGQAFRDCIDRNPQLCKYIVDLYNSKLVWTKPIKKQYGSIGDLCTTRPLPFKPLP